MHVIGITGADLQNLSSLSWDSDFRAHLPEIKIVRHSYFILQIVILYFFATFKKNAGCTVLLLIMLLHFVNPYTIGLALFNDKLVKYVALQALGSTLKNLEV